jgi:hypothetical protein
MPPAPVRIDPVRISDPVRINDPVHINDYERRATG